MGDLSGQTIRGYQLRELIGVGGVGAVYRAHQPSVGREVAIKGSTAKLTFWPPALAEIACPAVASLRRKSLI